MKKIKNNISKIVLYLVLAVSSFTIAFPFLWMISNSIKTKDEIWAMPPEVLPKIPQWINYLNVLREGDFFNYMWNSTSTAVICTVTVSYTHLTEVYSMSSSSAALLGVFRAYVMMMVGSLFGGLMASKMKSVIRFMHYGFIGMTIFSFSYLLIPVNRGMLPIVVVNFVLQGLFPVSYTHLQSSFFPSKNSHISS